MEWKFVNYESNGLEESLCVGVLIVTRIKRGEMYLSAISEVGYLSAVSEVGRSCVLSSK